MICSAAGKSAKAMRDDLRVLHALTESLGGTNTRELTHLSRLLRHAVKTELTARQADCFQLYFEQGFTMEQTARALSLTRGTVSKHIAKGVSRLRRVLLYSDAAAKWSRGKNAP